MNIEDIAFALLGGGAVGILTAIRGLRSDKYSRDEAARAALMTGYGGYMDELRHEIARVKEQCANELREQDERHARDREQWEREKAALQAELRELRAKVYELIDRSPDRPPTRRTRKEDDNED